MKHSTYILAILVLSLSVTSVHAATQLQKIRVEQGETLPITTNIGPQPGSVSEIAVSYEIPELKFYEFLKHPKPRTSVVTDQITFDMPPGIYLMDIQVWVNKKVVRSQQLFVEVTEQGAPKYVPTTNTNQSVNKTTQKPVVKYNDVSVFSIPPIPDVTAGTTFIMPVTITGKGTYQLEIPKLSFASYEVPGPITVEKSETASVLIHIDKNAKPGTYSIPVRAGNYETTVRIRIIQYTSPNNWFWLIPIGIVLVLLGIILILTTRKKNDDLPPPRPPQERQPESGELISYY